MSKDKKKVKVSKRILQLEWSKKKYAKKYELVVKKKTPKNERKRINKRLNKEYGEFVIVRLNKAVNILSKANEDSKKIERLKDAIIDLIADKKTMQFVAKEYKKNPDEYPYLVYLPYLITTTIMYYEQENLSEEDAAVAEKLDKEKLIEICETILKKPIKKYEKEGLSRTVAFQCAATVPTAKRISNVNNRRWMRTLIQHMYSLAETESIDFEAIISAIAKLDKKPPYSKKELREMFYSEVILSRSSNKNHSFTDSQKELNERLIESSLEYLNNLKSSKLRMILKNYIKSRKVAETYKNDGKRIIKFTDIANSNSEYEKIKSVVTDLIADDSSNELYLS